MEREEWERTIREEMRFYSPKESVIQERKRGVTAGHSLPVGIIPQFVKEP